MVNLQSNPKLANCRITIRMLFSSDVICIIIIPSYFSDAQHTPNVVMKIEKPLINNYLFEKYLENFIIQVFKIFVFIHREIGYFLKKQPIFNILYYLFCL